FFFSSRRRHTRLSRDWSSDVCSSDLVLNVMPVVQFIVAEGPGKGWADDVSMEITKTAPATTAQSIDHLDFDAGLTGWVLFPDPEIGRASCRDGDEAPGRQDHLGTRTQ